MIAIGIDSGTQSTKAIAVDLTTGLVVASAQKSYGMIEGLPQGHMEQDPQEWVDALDYTVAQVLQELGTRKQEVAAIGVSGQQHGFVTLDAQGRVIRPAKLWCDTSTTQQCREFDAEFGGPKYCF